MKCSICSKTITSSQDHLTMSRFKKLATSYAKLDYHTKCYREVSGKEYIPKELFPDQDEVIGYDIKTGTITFSDKANTITFGCPSCSELSCDCNS